MRLETIVVVAKREYLLRVKSKGFWIGTLILPFFAAAVTLLPAVFLSKSRTTQDLVVVDETGRIAERFAAVPKEREGGNERIARFEVKVEAPAADPDAQRAALDRRVLDMEIDAWVWVRPEVLTGAPVEYHARNLSNLLTQQILQRDLSAVVRRARLEQAGLDPDRIGELTGSVKLETVKVSAEGSRAEVGEGGAVFAFILFFMLYMALMVWGQQVMNGVLEEKGSRVIEVIVSAVKPFELMMGKLTGICLAGLTQFSVWLATFAVVTAPGMLASLAMMPEEISLPTVTLTMVFHLIILFILGFFTFSSLYAAIGAAFNNLQEAQQVASVAIFGLILPVFFIYPIINDPNSTFAVVTSLIPLFTPLLMTLRISLEMPPLWQILLAYALTLMFLWGMIWLCARIYRIGILMYGKKPTIQELWKWVRYA